MGKTPQEKREICQRLLVAWCAAPHLRLGQLMINSVYQGRSATDTATLFYADDAEIVSAVESYTKVTK
jgi:hypothetical protein